jgi:preprotein translocase subunit SecG
MQVFFNLILLVQIVCAVGIVLLVLLQQGKGADMGAAFGSGGGSGSLFGASGSANFLSRATAVLAGLFFISTLALAKIGSPRADMGSGSVLQGAVAPSAATASAAAAASAVQSAIDQIPGAAPAAPVAPAAAPVAPSTAPASAVVPAPAASKP